MARGERKATGCGGRGLEELSTRDVGHGEHSSGNVRDSILYRMGWQPGDSVAVYHATLKALPPAATASWSRANTKKNEGRAPARRGPGVSRGDAPQKPHLIKINKTKL
jgi:hypothetical protein